MCVLQSHTNPCKVGHRIKPELVKLYVVNVFSTLVIKVVSFFAHVHLCYEKEDIGFYNYLAYYTATARL